MILRSVLLVLIIVFLSFLIWVILWIFKPQLTIGVTNNDPAQNSVRVDGKDVETSKKETPNYSVRVWPGSRAISLRGPYVKDVEVKQSMPLFGSRRVEIVATKRTPEDIATKAVDNTSVQITDVRTFGNALVFIATQQSNPEINEENRYPVMIVYDKNTLEWKMLEPSEISTHQSTYTIPAEGLEHYYGLDNE